MHIFNYIVNWISSMVWGFLFFSLRYIFHFNPKTILCLKIQVLLLSGFNKLILKKYFPPRSLPLLNATLN